MVQAMIVYICVLRPSNREQSRQPVRKRYLHATPFRVGEDEGQPSRRLRCQGPEAHQIRCQTEAERDQRFRAWECRGESHSENRCDLISVCSQFLLSKVQAKSEDPGGFWMNPVEQWGEVLDYPKWLGILPGSVPLGGNGKSVIDRLEFKSRR